MPAVCDMSYINWQRLPVAISPPPDVLKRMYTESLVEKTTMAARMADIEQSCHDWEGAVRQMLGDAEAQKIFEAHVFVDVDETDTVKGRYITAVTRLRMQDFCLSRRGGTEYGCV